MQPHNVENPRPSPGNDKDPKRGSQTTFWLMIVGLLTAITVNLLGRL